MSHDDSTASAAASSTSPTVTVITDQAIISSYNLGPVITQYTPPVSCVATFTSYLDNSLNFAHSLDAPYNSACYPPILPNPASLWTIYYWSPAQCPSGWTVATTFDNIYYGRSAGLSLGTDTSAALCCPTGYQYANLGHLCATTALTNNFVPMSLLYYSAGSSQADLSNFAPTTSATLSILSDNLIIMGDGIPVWWQSSDLSNFASASRTSTLSTSTSSNISQSPTTSTSTSATTSTTISPTPSPGGLSSGAKIGIGIGIPLVVLICGFIGFFVYRRRSRFTAAPSSEVDGLETHKNQELSHDGALSELYTPRKPVELQAAYNPHQHLGPPSELS